MLLKIAISWIGWIIFAKVRSNNAAGKFIGYHTKIHADRKRTGRTNEESLQCDTKSTLLFAHSLLFGSKTVIEIRCSKIQGIYSVV